MWRNNIDPKDQLDGIKMKDLEGDDEGFVELEQVTVIKHEIQCDPETPAQQECASTIGGELVVTKELEDLDAAVLLTVAKVEATKDNEAIAGVFQLFGYAALNAAHKTGELAKQAFEYSGFAELAEEVAEYIADRTQDDAPTANATHSVTDLNSSTKRSQAPRPDRT